MCFDKEDFEVVLSQYGIHESIVSSELLFEMYDNNEIKVITKCNYENRSPIILKLLHEDRHPHYIIEQQSAFSELLRSNGILTPKRYKSKGIYCGTYDHNGIVYDTTVEDYLGEEIKLIDIHLAFLVGKLMGEMHKISAENNCHISTKTIFDLMGYNEVSGFNTFMKYVQSGVLPCMISEQIINEYRKRISIIKMGWDQLPRFASQGDISINNLTQIGNEIGIFDYNIAGDAVLVCDLVLEALLTAYEMDIPDTVKRSDIFIKFIEGYLSVYKLGKQELRAAWNILIVSDAFWFKKFKYTDNSLSCLVERHDTKRIGIFLKELLSTIQDDSSDMSRIFN